MCSPAWPRISAPSGPPATPAPTASATRRSWDAWAVGIQSSGSRWHTLVEHWDGTAWSIVPSPNPGSDNNYLQTVAAASADDIWAAGYYWNGSADRTLTEHWDGTAWSIVPSPN